MLREADVDIDWSKANLVEACEVFYRCGNGFDNVAELHCVTMYLGVLLTDEEGS